MTRISTLRALSLALILSALLAACGTTGTTSTPGTGGVPSATQTPAASATPLPPPTEPSLEEPPADQIIPTLEQLEGSEWNFKGFKREDGMIDALPGGEVTANFDNLGELHGSTGCNSYHAKIELSEGALRVGPVQMTRMACVEQGLQQQEPALVNALGSASTIAREGDLLVIGYADGQLHFQAVPEPEASPLTGSSWQLISFDLGDVVQQVVPGSKVTLEFQVGQLGGSAGCNSYGGEYSADASALTVGDVASTMMLCADEKVMQQEGAFTRALSLASAYEVKDDELAITYDGGILRFVRTS